MSRWRIFARGLATTPKHVLARGVLMKDVLVVGMAVVDYLFEVEDLPWEAEKYVAHEASVVGGGGAANAACAIARLGGNASLAARVGDDFNGNLILQDLQQRSVDCSRVNVCAQGQSSFSSVLLDANGERQIVNFRGRDLSDDTSLIEKSNPDAVLADTRWQSGAVAAMTLARQKNIPAVLDAEEPVDVEIMKLSTHVAFSKQGLESCVGAVKSVSDVKEALQTLAKTYPVWLAMTDGANGVYSFYQGEFYHQPARVVEVTDTLGAGDVWHGAFTYRLACGNSEHEAVEFATAAATLKCMYSGGGRSSPDIAAVTHFLQTTDAGA